MKEKLGPTNMVTVATMNNLAVHYMNSNRTAEAAEILELIVEVQRETLGAENRQTLVSEGNLGSAYSELDETGGHRNFQARRGEDDSHVRCRPSSNSQ